MGGKGGCEVFGVGGGRVRLVGGGGGGGGLAEGFGGGELMKGVMIIEGVEVSNEGW